MFSNADFSFSEIFASDTKTNIIIALIFILSSIALSFKFFAVLFQIALVIFAVWLIKVSLLPEFNIREKFPNIFEQKNESTSEETK